METRRWEYQFIRFIQPHWFYILLAAAVFVLTGFFVSKERAELVSPFGNLASFLTNVASLLAKLTETEVK